MLKRPKHAGLRHVALNVVEFEKMEYFYSELLGFEEEWRPDPDNLYLCSGVDNLALHKVDDRGGKAQALDHIGIICDTMDNVDEWYEFLNANEVKMVNTPKTHRDGARSFYCFDPEGNTLQVIFHPPISKGS